MKLDIDKFFILLGALGCFFWLLKKMQKKEPSFATSLLPPLFLKKRTWRVRLFSVQKAAVWLLLFLLALPFCNLRLSSKKNVQETLSREGIAIYLLIDDSGSMKEKGAFDGADYRKIDWAKKLAKDLVEHQKNDLIGVISFARKANIVSPLTLDHEALFERIDSIQPVPSEDEEGTAIGYAIYKTVNLIVSTKQFAARNSTKKTPAFTIKNQVIILVTDGLQSPNPQDRNSPYRFMRPDEAIDYAEKNGIAVYYLGVDPVLTRQEFYGEAEKMRQEVVASGGAFYISTSKAPLVEIEKKLSLLEKSEIIQPKEGGGEREESLSGICIGAALTLLCFVILLETVFLRVAP
jgi:Ca-activated chloride channel homolog